MSLFYFRRGPGLVVMRIIVNTTNIQVGGGLQVSYSIINELKNIDQHEYHVFLSPQVQQQITKSDFPENFHFYSFDRNPTKPLTGVVTFRQKLSRLERKIKPDFVLSVFGPAFWKPRAPHLVGFAQGYFLFEKSPFIQNVLLTNVWEKLKYYSWQFIMMNSIKHEGTLWWIETQDAKEHLASAFRVSGNRVHVITNTHGRQYAEAPVVPVGTLPTEPFTFLYLASRYRQKNLGIFNSIIPKLHDAGIRCKFLLTLPPADFDAMFTDKTVLSMLENLGPVKPADGPAAYNSAHAVFIPTLLETFSANYPEAMKMERPILTSDLPFAHTVCGDAAHYFNPFDARDVVEQIRYFIDDAGHRQALVENGKRQLANFDTAQTRAKKLVGIMETYHKKLSA